MVMLADPLRAAFAAADFEREAARTVDPGVTTYLSGGAQDELNLDAFRRARVRPRILADRPIPRGATVR